MRGYIERRRPRAATTKGRLRDRTCAATEAPIASVVRLQWPASDHLLLGTLLETTHVRSTSSTPNITNGAMFTRQPVCTPGIIIYAGNVMLLGAIDAMANLDRRWAYAAA